MTLFFRLNFHRKSSEITNNKPIFNQYNIFYNYEYFFFQSAFWSLFNHHQRSQSNQEQCSLCCSSLYFCVLQCFSTYFRKLKEIGVLRPIFPDYIISCDYDFLWLDGNLNRTIKRKTNDKTLIIILQSIKTTYAECCVYDVKKYMKNIYLD